MIQTNEEERSGKPDTVFINSVNNIENNNKKNHRQRVGTMRTITYPLIFSVN
jgi:hypothetical protein